jgi:hypothetical protein
VPQPFNAPAVGGHATVPEGMSGEGTNSDNTIKHSNLCMLRYYLD